MATAVRTIERPAVPQWTVGDRIRKALGHLDQDAVGAQLGKGKGTVSGWCQDKALPSFKDMEAFCDITNVPLWWIMGHDTDPGPDGAGALAYQAFKREQADARSR